MKTPDNKSIEVMIGQRALSLESAKNKLAIIKDYIVSENDESSPNEELAQSLLEMERTLTEVIRLSELTQHESVFEKNYISIGDEQLPVMNSKPRFEAAKDTHEPNKKELAEVTAQFNKLESDFKKEYPDEGKLIARLLVDENKNTTN